MYDNAQLQSPTPIHSYPLLVIPLHSTLYTLHSTLYTLHSTLYPPFPLILSTTRAMAPSPVTLHAVPKLSIVM